MRKKLLPTTSLITFLLIILFFLTWVNKIKGNQKNTLLAILTPPALNRPATHKDLSSFNREINVDLRENGYVRSAKLKSYLKELFSGVTEIYLGSNNTPQITLIGLFHQAFTTDIESDGGEELVVEVETGQSIDTSIYKYSNGYLNRISISNGSSTVYESVTTRNPPEFNDADGDGKLEMFVYYRFFPPEKRRKVEVYKFNGEVYQKENEYEEAMNDLYL